MIPILKKNPQKTCVDFFEKAKHTDVKSEAYRCKIKFPISDDDIFKWYLLI